MRMAMENFSNKASLDKTRIIASSNNTFNSSCNSCDSNLFFLHDHILSAFTVFDKNNDDKAIIGTIPIHHL